MSTIDPINHFLSHFNLPPGGTKEPKRFAPDPHREWIELSGAEQAKILDAWLDSNGHDLMYDFDETNFVELITRKRAEWFAFRARKMTRTGEGI